MGGREWGKGGKKVELSTAPFVPPQGHTDRTGHRHDGNSLDAGHRLRLNLARPPAAPAAADGKRGDVCQAEPLPGTVLRGEGQRQDEGPNTVPFLLPSKVNATLFLWAHGHPISSNLRPIGRETRNHFPLKHTQQTRVTQTRRAPNSQARLAQRCHRVSGPMKGASRE